MYSDGVSGRKRSVMDRLGSGGGRSVSRPRPDAAKSFCQADGTWRRELYKDSGGSRNYSGLTSIDLQSNQKLHLQGSNEVVKKASAPDLREKLSGVKRSQLNSTVQIPKPVAEIAKTAKPLQKREPPTSSTILVTKKVNASTALKQSQSPRELPASSAITKIVDAPTALKQPQSQEKADVSLNSLLESLDLQKYIVNFEAEEVDMKALVHMNEEDMKSLGIPMGPRKKILSALASKKRKSSRSLRTS